MEFFPFFTALDDSISFGLWQNCNFTFVFQHMSLDNWCFAQTFMYRVSKEVFTAELANHCTYFTQIIIVFSKPLVKTRALVGGILPPATVTKVLLHVLYKMVTCSIRELYFNAAWPRILVIHMTFRRWYWGPKLAMRNHNSILTKWQIFLWQTCALNSVPKNDYGLSKTRQK